jgi:hypothetical protein
VTAGLPRSLRCYVIWMWLCPRGEIALTMSWEVVWGDLREGRARVDGVQQSRVDSVQQSRVDGVQLSRVDSVQQSRVDSVQLSRVAASKRTLYCLISKKKGRRPLGLQKHRATSRIRSRRISNPTAASPLALSVSNLAAPWLRKGRAVVWCEGEPGSKCSWSWQVTGPEKRSDSFERVGGTSYLSFPGARRNMANGAQDCRHRAC